MNDYCNLVFADLKSRDITFKQLIASGVIIPHIKLNNTEADSLMLLDEAISFHVISMLLFISVVEAVTSFSYGKSSN